MREVEYRDYVRQGRFFDLDDEESLAGGVADRLFGKSVEEDLGDPGATLAEVLDIRRDGRSVVIELLYADGDEVEVFDVSVTPRDLPGRPCEVGDTVYFDDPTEGSGVGVVVDPYDPSSWNFRQTGGQPVGLVEPKHLFIHVRMNAGFYVAVKPEGARVIRGS